MEEEGHTMRRLIWGEAAGSWSVCGRDSIPMTALRNNTKTVKKAPQSEQMCTETHTRVVLLVCD